MEVHHLVYNALPSMHALLVMNMMLYAGDNVALCRPGARTLVTPGNRPSFFLSFPLAHLQQQIFPCPNEEMPKRTERTIDKRTHGPAPGGKAKRSREETKTNTTSTTSHETVQDSDAEVEPTQPFAELTSESDDDPEAEPLTENEVKPVQNVEPPVELRSEGRLFY